MIGARHLPLLLGGSALLLIVFASYQWGRASRGEDIALDAARIAAEAVSDDVKAYQGQINRRTMLAERQAAFDFALDAIPTPTPEVIYETEPCPGGGSVPVPRWRTIGLRDERRARNAALATFTGSPMPSTEPGSDDPATSTAGSAGRNEPR